MRIELVFPQQARKLKPVKLRGGQTAPAGRMRVIIATVTAGAGHVQAAAALEEAWNQERPRDVVRRLYVLEFTPKLYRRIYVEAYLKVVEHAPELWAHVFKKTDNPGLVRKLGRLRRALTKLTASKFLRQMERFRPAAVLCTHYLPLEMLGHLQTEGSSGLDPFTVSIVTDFEVHALWMDPGVDLYCVAAEESKARLVARGVPAELVAVTGIPVASRFSGQWDAGELRRRLGLRDDLPTVLVLGGGFGIGPLEEILLELNKMPQPMQLLVVCGRNEELRRKLAVLERRHPTHVFGYVTNMHELMAVAQLVITKPGGLTSSEALALGKPIFVLNPIPGQEAANSDFLLEHGVAAKANRVEDVPFRLEKLLGTERLEGMARAARELGRPGAALEICRRTLERLPAELIERPRGRVARAGQGVL